MHNYTAWRDALDPHLTGLLRQVWEVRRCVVTRVELTPRPSAPPAPWCATGTGAARSWSSRPSRAGLGLASNGMVGAVGELIEAGRVKLYCVDSLRRAQSWSAHDLPMEERARRHGRYESWIVDQVVPFIRADSGGAGEIATTGCSHGRVPRAELRAEAGRPVPARDVPVRQLRPGEPGTAGASAATRRTSTTRSTTWHTCGDHLDWLRSRLSVLLVVRAGPVGGHHRLAGVHQARWPACWPGKGLRAELDLWGHDVPHDWPSWRAQFAHHLPRFC